jgi:hypothetical protein
MAVTYTLETGSLNQGLADTFDGDHPCAMCLAVKKGQQEEQKSPDAPKPKDLKLQLALHRNAATYLQLIANRRDIVPDTAERPDRRSEEPALPPPRA